MKKNLIKLLFSVLLTIILISSLNAQTNSDKPLSWKGVSIDTSNSNDIIAKFGKAEKEETDRLDIPFLKTKDFSPKAYEKEWKVFKYKEIEKAQKVRFGFDKNDNLVYIQFKPPNKNPIDVQAFLKAYDSIEFKVIDKVSTFILKGEHNGGYILAEVTANIFLQKRIKDENDTGSLTGIITNIQFISKTLENRENTDILK